MIDLGQTYIQFYSFLFQKNYKGGEIWKVCQKCNHKLLDEIMFKSLERSTRLQRALSLFLTHFITLSIFSHLLLCVCFVCFAVFCLFVCFNKSFLIYLIALLYFFCFLCLTTIQCVRLKWTLRVCVFCVCEKGAWLVHFRRLNQNKKKINGNKHMFKRKATSKPRFRYITRLFSLTVFLLSS